jgi:hypothetical protein
MYAKGTMSAEMCIREHTGTRTRVVVKKFTLKSDKKYKNTEKHGGALRGMCKFRVRINVTSGAHSSAPPQLLTCTECEYMISRKYFFNCKRFWNIYFLRFLSVAAADEDELLTAFIPLLKGRWWNPLRPYSGCPPTTWTWRTLVSGSCPPAASWWSEKGRSLLERGLVVKGGVRWTLHHRGCVD